MNDTKFLLTTLVTDKYMILFAICAIMVPTLAWYLNNWGSDRENRVPFWHARAAMASAGFLAFGLLISLAEVSIYGYETVKTKQCVSKNHDSAEISRYLQERETRTIRRVELNHLMNEEEACQWENLRERGLTSRLGERPADTSSI